MKSEVGMYVRTKEGYIAKCTYIDEDLESIYVFDSAIRRSFGDEYDFIHCEEQEKYIIKTSHNIIDILENWDFVSTITGECALITGVYHDINGKKYIRLCNCIGDYYEDDIKSIITHEQMEQMAYKVEE